MSATATGQHRVAFLHASPAALAALRDFYTAEAPELEITNLLDDGLMRLFHAGNNEKAMARLMDMCRAARGTHDAELAMLTCSAVLPEDMKRLRGAVPLPLFKIDEPMAHRAVAAGSRLGVVVSFRPTIETTRALLLETAAAAGQMKPELVLRFVDGAYQALLDGDAATHDNGIEAAARQLSGEQVHAVVLSQISMARVVPRLADLPMPVFSSLETSLEAIRGMLPSRPVQSRGEHV